MNDPLPKPAQRVAVALGLPLPLPYGQDYAHELPDEYLTSAWLDRYLAARRRNVLDRGEASILTDLIMDCADSIVQHEPGQRECVYSALKQLFEGEAPPEREVLEYWAVLDAEDEDECFALTLVARRLLRDLGAAEAR